MNIYRCLGCGASQAITLASKACEYCGKPIVHPSAPSVSNLGISATPYVAEQTQVTASDEPSVGFSDRTFFYFKKALKATFNFSGRASKAEYWFFVVAIFCIFVTSSVLQDWLIDSFIGDLIGLAQGLFFILVIVTSTSLGIRRLHDVDRSGFWYLLCLIPLFGTLVLLWWSIQNGTSGSNTYGEQPEDL